MGHFALGRQRLVSLLLLCTFACNRVHPISAYELEIRLQASSDDTKQPVCNISHILINISAEVKLLTSNETCGETESNDTETNDTTDALGNCEILQF